MLEKLKRDVCEANKELMRKGIVIYSWGNVSGIDDSEGLMVIKPSGVDYDALTPDMMVVVDVSSGKVVEGRLNPSTDTPTHLELYRHFPDIGGITHTHSVNAVSFAQAGLSIPAFGTTHADHFYGDVPCTRALTSSEVNGDYELNTGKVICETMDGLGYGSKEMPAVLVKNHGPFCWGKDAFQSVKNAVVLEQVAQMAFNTIILNKQASMDRFILDKHYNRKNGVNSYYGQKNESK